MKVIGLTGGIATGKTTIAEMFEDASIAVFDADKYVHHLLEMDNGLIRAILGVFPTADAGGRIDRKVLGRIVFSDDDQLKRLESLIHPAVRQAEHDFLYEQEAAGAKAAVLDIPLLFETKADALCDLVVVVDCEPETQKQRVLARPNMSETKYQGIIDRQMKRDERNGRADHVISTDQPLDACRERVKSIISEL